MTRRRKRIRRAQRQVRRSTPEVSFITDWSKVISTMPFNNDPSAIDAAEREAWEAVWRAHEVDVKP